MTEEILKLLYDYSINCKVADKEFIEKIIEIVVNSRSISDYVRKVDFNVNFPSTNSSVVCGLYAPLGKKISFDYKNILIDIKRQSKRYLKLFNGFEQIMFKNLIVTQMILHELEHANQHKKADNKDNQDLEVKLIRASNIVAYAYEEIKDSLDSKEMSMSSFRAYLGEYKKLYLKYYDFVPKEKMAQAYSYTKILETIAEIRKQIPNLYDFERAALVEELLKGYEKSLEIGAVCPAEVYLKGTDQDSIWTAFDFYYENTSTMLQNARDSYTLGRRLSFGLPISNSEYDELNDKFRATNKYTSVR